MQLVGFVSGVLMCVAGGSAIGMSIALNNPALTITGVLLVVAGHLVSAPFVNDYSKRK